MSEKTPKVCSMPQMKGITVAKQESIVDMVPADLNLDGKKEEYFTVTRKILTLCGEMPKEALFNQVTALFGKQDSHTDTAEGGKLTGPFWNAEYSVSDNMTKVKTHLAMPIFPLKNQTPFPIKHLKKSVQEDDPVTIKGSKGTYFVVRIVITDAVRWDGRNMTVNYDGIKLQVISKAKLVQARNGKELSQDDTKVIRMADIKSVEDRSAFPEIYAPPKKAE
ncbi:MAG: hypothetical protein JXA24_07855 [Proteobacteria bacterium]|nr:hypothetical protein [Pseudomonadota bacterium]